MRGTFIYHFRLWCHQSANQLWDTLEFIRYLWCGVSAYQIACWILPMCAAASYTTNDLNSIADCRRIMMMFTHFTFFYSSIFDMTTLRDPSMHVKPHRIPAHNKYLIGKSNTTFIDDQFHIMSNLRCHRVELNGEAVSRKSFYRKYVWIG